MINFVNFPAKNYLLNWFIRVKIKLRFPLETQLLVLLKRLFKLVAVELMF